MKKLPVGLQSFGLLREEDYVYVDKTRDIYELVTGASKYYFLSRPRRFGKSLLISTLKEMFSGNKELFKDLWIYPKLEWQSHPVIHIDFLGLNYRSESELIDTLNYLLLENAKRFSIKLEEKDYDKRFRELILKLAENHKNKIVILVDEYDKPLIDNITHPATAIKNRDVLQTFYSTIKWAGEYLRFVLITGVSKFSKVSIFSGLNNLSDITMDDRYSGMLGYTGEELEHYFPGYIEELGKRFPGKDLLEHIKRWYDGYSWDGINFVYNPYSILKLLDKKEFENYWFSTGTPTFLVNLIKESRVNVREFESRPVDQTISESNEVDDIDLLSLMFQTGYLTIKSVQPLGLRKRYTLAYPNEEVKEAFLKYLLSGYTGLSPAVAGDSIFELAGALLDSKIDDFFEKMKGLFASMPYDIFIGDKEAYYHSIFYMALKLVGIHVRAEVHTNKGRIDCVLRVENRIYIMEFKMGTAEKALSQIKEKKYYEQYLSSSVDVFLVGVGFDEKERNISGYIVEQL